MKKQERRTKMGEIQKRLERYGVISDPIARDKIHTNRLSGYIHVLRKRGWVIETEWCKSKDEFGVNRFGKYRLIKKGV